MRLPPRPLLDWSDELSPRSLDVGDVYFAGDGLAEKRAVFVNGCGLPNGWRGRSHFTIGELGFGAGLAFLAAWDAWRTDRPTPDARLDFLSFESAPMSADDARRIHARWSEVADISAELRAGWPHRARGLQRIALSHGVTLTIAIGEIAKTLPLIRARVDSWFLDGFSPSKNPEMWSAETLRHVARLSAPGARAATYSVAGDVRRALEAAGFDARKAPNIGRKKERLEAVLAPEPPSPLWGGVGVGGRAAGEPSAISHSANVGPPPTPTPPHKGEGRTAVRSVLIIGAGVAGALTARAFIQRGADVTVLDAGEVPGAGASGNPLALVMPRLDADDGPAARTLVAAWLAAHRTWSRLGAGVSELDVRHSPRDATQAKRFARLLADPPLDETFLAAGEDGALLHRRALAIRPAEALPALLSGASLRFGARVTQIAETDNGARISLASGETIDAHHIVICAGISIGEIVGVAAPPLTGRLGQVETMPYGGADLARADGGYLVAAQGLMSFGATFETANGPAMISQRAREENLATLARLAPEMTIDHAGLASRAAIRATTQDRLPIAGAAPLTDLDQGGLPRTSPAISLIGGLGARGYLWAPVLADMIAAQAFDEPAPLDIQSISALEPLRFARRAQRRGG